MQFCLVLHQLTIVSWHIVVCIIKWVTWIFAFSFIIMSNAQINTCEDKWVMINLILMQPYGIRGKLEPSCSPLLKLVVKLQDNLSHRMQPNVILVVNTLCKETNCYHVKK
jgi:hypothetical protein